MHHTNWSPGKPLLQIKHPLVTNVLWAVPLHPFPLCVSCLWHFVHVRGVPLFRGDEPMVRLQWRGLCLTCTQAVKRAAFGTHLSRQNHCKLHRSPVTVHSLLSKLIQSSWAPPFPFCHGWAESLATPYTH